MLVVHDFNSYYFRVENIIYTIYMSVLYYYIIEECLLHIGKIIVIYIFLNVIIINSCTITLSHSHFFTFLCC